MGRGVAIDTESASGKVAAVAGVAAREQDGVARKWRRNGLKRLNPRPEMVWAREPRTYKIWYAAAADHKRLRLRGRENDKVGKLQKKAPNVLKRLDAELKSAPDAVLRTPGHAHPARPRTVASKGRIFEARRDGRADA